MKDQRDVDNQVVTESKFILKVFGVILEKKPLCKNCLNSTPNLVTVLSYVYCSSVKVSCVLVTYEGPPPSVREVQLNGRPSSGVTEGFEQEND